VTNRKRDAVEGSWVNRVNGLESMQVDIVIVRTQGGHGLLELTKFRNPKLVEIHPAITRPNTRWAAGASCLQSKA
jgi:hypothetical protein